MGLVPAVLAVAAVPVFAGPVSTVNVFSDAGSSGNSHGDSVGVSFDSGGFDGVGNYQLTVQSAASNTGKIISVDGALVNSQNVINGVGGVDADGEGISCITADGVGGTKTTFSCGANDVTGPGQTIHLYFKIAGPGTASMNNVDVTFDTALETGPNCPVRASNPKVCLSSLPTYPGLPTFNPADFPCPRTTPFSASAAAAGCRNVKVPNSIKKHFKRHHA